MDGVDNGGEVYTCIIVYTRYVCIDIRYDNLQMAAVLKVGRRTRLSEVETSLLEPHLGQVQLLLDRTGGRGQSRGLRT